MKTKLFLSLAFISFIFTSCNTASEPYLVDKTGVISYEATVADPTNYKIQVGYIEENSTTLKQVVVESPFKYQLSAKTGTLIYLSVTPVSRVSNYVGSTTVKGTIYIDNSLFKTDSDETFSSLGFTYGVN